MHIVVEHAGRTHEVDVQVDRATASVSDLLARLDPIADAPGTGLLLDGRFHTADERLHDLPLYPGAAVTVTTHPAGQPLPQPDDAEVLVTVTGPDAGTVHRLDGDVVVVGRSPGCDVVIDDATISRRHARLERIGGVRWRIIDLGSSNGTWIDGDPVTRPQPVPDGVRLRLGAVHVHVRRITHEDQVDPLDGGWHGPQPFNRPPRPGLPGPAPLLVGPDPPQPAHGGRMLNAVGLAGPILLGGTLVMITGSLRYALFVLMSPVLLVGNHVAGRRRAAAQRRAHAAALERLAEDLAHRRDVEQRRVEEQRPDLAEVVRRATAPAVSLWQRRPRDADFLRLRVGTGDVPWDPPVAPSGGTPAPELTALLDRFRTLPRGPVQADLSGGSVLGLVGNRNAAVALARSLLCQVGVHHGPADVTVVVAASDDHAPDWDWTKWLPHTGDGTGTTRLLAGDHATATTMLDGLLAAPDTDGGDASGRRPAPGGPGPVTLYVVDDITLWRGRQAPARLLLSGAAGPATGIVVAAREEQLPAVCDTVVELHDDLGAATLRRPQERQDIDRLVIAGASDDTARRCARALARFEDPELAVAGAGLPTVVRLLPLLGMQDIDPATVRAAWCAGLPDPPPRTPIGRGEHGPVVVDLVRDGPHGLIAGTTGSGKSELLRTLVAGLAARVDPDHLVFVLVDYKGGSAFDDAARLPHVVGLVTDLDDHLGERALRSLEAELRHRERVLRHAGAQDLPDYLRGGAPLGPLPRLVVVIDEFATLAAELPDFLGALVGVAQRGRSLGMHLLLATQRPRGAIDADIIANTSLRIALRVQDPADSTDVIDCERAAHIGRGTPGRAYVRLGPDDLEVVQTALATLPAPAPRSTSVTLWPLRFGREPVARPVAPGDRRPVGPSDLGRLVEAVMAAFTRSGRPSPRRPWLEMLPPRLDLADLAGRDYARDPVVFALADDPDRQRQVPVGWDPTTGHLALFGMVGSGTTTAVLAIACAVAAAQPPDRCHLYALDFGAGDLAALAALPHTGAVIGANERERQFVLVRTLRRELDRRRDLPANEREAEPSLMILIDGIAAFLAEHEGLEGQVVTDGFRRLLSEGPAVGIWFVVAGDRVGALPARLSALIGQRLLFRLADTNDYASIGLRATELPAFVPGRAIEAGGRRVVQIGLPGDLDVVVTAARRRWGEPDRPPRRVEALPRRLPLEAVPGVAVVGEAQLRVPIGVTGEDRGPATLVLHPGEHAAVLGRPRSGKSLTLVTIAHQLRRADAGLVLVAVCRDHSPLFGMATLDAYGTPDTLAGVLDAAPEDSRPWVVLVDDADVFDDPDGHLRLLAACARAGLHVIAAGRTDGLRGDYGGWTRTVRRSRTGLLLQPDLSADGDLFGVRLPRRLATPLVAGRGLLIVGGETQLAQIALPPTA